jgi:hypothetical protein
MNTTSRFAFLAALVAIGSSPVLAAQSRDWPDGQNSYGMVTRDGLNAYARVPHQDLNSQQFNGGGSSGYNAGEKIH